jgi:RNA polymerase sigma factor (sigma-70 family)
MGIENEPINLAAWKQSFRGSLSSSFTVLAGRELSAKELETYLEATFIHAEKLLSPMHLDEKKALQPGVWLREVAEEAFVKELLTKLALNPYQYFEQMYYAYVKPLRGYLRKKLNDENALDDCLQMTFMAAYNALKRRRIEDILCLSHLKGWLFRIAEHACYEYWEKHARSFETPVHGTDRMLSFTLKSLEEESKGNPLLAEQVPQEKFPQPEKEVERLETKDELHRCVERLPELCRSAIKLYFFQDVPLDKIAFQLDLPPGTVRAYIYRDGPGKLRKLLYNLENEDHTDKK